VRGNQPRQILIVDDDGTIRTLLAAALEEGGYRVIAAASGLSMRELLIQGGVDAVVLDVQMPEEDGHSLALHAQDLGLPLVMMSGSGDAVAFAERLGLQLLRKPFRMQQLFAALDAALADARGRAENIQ
jgi:two-component system, OmpR family, response regulator